MTTRCELAILQWDDFFKRYDVTADTEELEILGYFLTTDCFSNARIDKCLAWIFDSTQTHFGGNLTGLDKNEPEKGICFSTDMNFGEPPYLYLPPDNVIEMLNAWKKIVESMPQEVTLIMGNGRVRVEATGQ